jgi:chemotaxis signal transduction protein
LTSVENKVHFVVFSSHHIPFGVYAEQVEELLDGKTLCIQERLEQRDMLPYRGDDIRLIDFSTWLASKVDKQKIRAEERAPSPPVDSRNILIIYSQQKGYIGIGIHYPEELIALSISQIHTLPVLMQKVGLIKAIWGIALVEDRPIVLIDLLQIE